MIFIIYTERFFLSIMGWRSSSQIYILFRLFLLTTIIYKYFSKLYGDSLYILNKRRLSIFNVPEKKWFYKTYREPSVLRQKNHSAQNRVLKFLISLQLDGNRLKIMQMCTRCLKYLFEFKLTSVDLCNAIRK